MFPGSTFSTDAMWHWSPISVFCSSLLLHFLFLSSSISLSFASYTLFCLTSALSLHFYSATVSLMFFLGFVCHVATAGSWGISQGCDNHSINAIGAESCQSRSAQINRVRDFHSGCRATQPRFAPTGRLHNDSMLTVYFEAK